MNEITTVSLEMNPIQFVALKALLEHVQLGGRNTYEKEISRLMTNLDNTHAEFLVQDTLQANGLKFPSIAIEFNHEDGLNIKVS